jgi:hypothetical protein
VLSSRRQVSLVDRLVCQAIQERRLIEFSLHGLPRIAEVHLYGTHKGAQQMLVYQVGGASKSGGLPHWRRVALGDVTGLRLLDERFTEMRLSEPHPAGWDSVFLIVS